MLKHVSLAEAALYVALDGADNLYFIDVNGGVGVVTTSVSSAAPVTTVPLGPLIVDSQNVYVSTGDSVLLLDAKSVQQASLGGPDGGAQVDASALGLRTILTGPVRAIAVDGTCLYWTDALNGTVQSAALPP